MMEKAGYLQRTGCRALDSEGVIHEVIELHIHGSRYALRLKDLSAGIPGRVYIQIEEIIRHWNYYLGNTCGLAQVSVSGKALNIDLFDNGHFTISLTALRAVIFGKERYAAIVKIPEQPVQPILKIRRVDPDQQQISALV